MRRPLPYALLALLSSAAIFWFLRPRAEFDLMRAAPDSALAALIVNDPSRALDLPAGAALPEWLPADPGEFLDKVPPEIREQVSALLREDLEKALWIVHRLEKKESGAWKIHFSALLRPKPRRGRLVEKRIEAAMAAAFGSGMETFDSGPLRLYRGPRAGQTLHQARLPGLLLVSNTERGRDQTLASWIGKEPRLRDRPGFRRVAARLNPDRGIFFYCDCRKLLPVLPEFGYAVEWVDGEARERTYLVE